MGNWARVLGIIVLSGCLSPKLAFGQEAGDTTRVVPAVPDSVAYKLERLVVTAHLIPVPAEKIAPRVTVLTGEELQARGIHFVSDALRQIAGAAVVEGGSFGSLTSLFLRGGESDYVQVLVDGIPVNEPGGSFDFANLTTDNIERIEILRGPGSVLYGSDAMTGVVQIFTRRGQGRFTVQGGVRGGTLGTVVWNGDVNGGTQRIRYSVGASRFSSDGILDLNNDFRNTVVSGRLDLVPDDRTEASVSVRYTDAEFHFPTDGAGQISDANQFQTRQDISVTAKASRFLTRKLVAHVQVGVDAGDLNIDDQADGPADTLGFFAFSSNQDVDRRTLNMRLDYHLSPSTIVTLGGELEEEEFRSGNSFKSEFGPDESEMEASRSTRALYAQVLTDLTPRLSVSLGARLDDNDEFGTFDTYRAGAVYRLPGGIRVRSSFGIGFKEPTFFENFAEGFVLGNSELDPERSRSWEIGADYELLQGDLRFGLTYFDQNFRDLIQFTFVPPEEGAPNFFNVASADADGLELEARWQPVAGLFVETAYTYLDTKVVDAGLDEGPGAAFVEGRSLLRRPDQTLSMVLGYREARGGALSLAVRRVGERDDLDFSGFPGERVRLPSYVAVDLAASWPIQLATGGLPGFAPTLRVENLLDDAHEEVKNFPAPGRTIFAGIRILLGIR